MSDNNRYEEKEIDLLYIFRSVKKGFLNFLQSIGDLALFAIKNIKTLLLFVIIGIGSSVCFFYLKKPVYDSVLTISHSRLNNGQCADLVNGLSKVADDTLLADMLGMSVKQVKEIKNISFSQINKNDSSFLISNFKIEAKVYNASILDSLQNGIMNFLESNEYATKRKQIHQAFLDKIEERIKGEIIAIDSLKRVVDKSILPRSLGNGIILGESIDPVKVYKESMDLYKSQLNISEQKELNNSFEVIIGFSPAISSAGLFINIVKGVILSLLFGMLWLLIKKYNINKKAD